MPLINRFSSRLHRLDQDFLAKRLASATSYRRIAGYFRSSILELVGEQIAAIPDVRIVCNSELDAADISISKAVRDAALTERWNDVAVDVESLLHHERYRRLHDLLVAGNVQIRVVPRDRLFLHGKAGVIEGPEGKTCFLGSTNETRSAFAKNYEILWEDPSPEGVAWVEEEFEVLWNDAWPLPDAIVAEIGRVADRIQVRFDQLSATEIPGAALAESPLYRAGEQLQPWQRAFVALFLEHRQTYGRARLLLADEVGLGKTLSLATSAMASVLLGDGPVLILCPSTLTLQWQVELKDRLGIPSAVWHSTRKVWIDPDGHTIRTRGAEDVVRCPYQIAIVSTGLLLQPSEEKRFLLQRKYGTVILDEAHKARRRGSLGGEEQEANNLLAFMLQIAGRTTHLLLGTATPIQTDVRELWDLLAILNHDAEFVAGSGVLSYWTDFDRSLPFVKGDSTPDDEQQAWEMLRNPLPPGEEHPQIAVIRTQLGIDDHRFFSDAGFASLPPAVRNALSHTLDDRFFRENNPIVRHTVVRRRETLERQGFLQRIAVRIHPLADAPATLYPGQSFIGAGLLTSHPFDLAYQAAEELTAELARRTRSAGFMKTLLLQRICSSIASGRATAERMLRRELLDDDEDAARLDNQLDGLTPAEAACLRTIVAELSRPEARDPKLEAIRYFLLEHRTEARTWLEHGCIIFSQYFDTARWIAEELADVVPTSELVAVYAGAGRSGIYRDGRFTSVERDDIKKLVKERRVRLVVATDAACEGLNLQTLGTLINIDLPWNPSRLQQRLGRILRFGQARTTVDMLNLVYHATHDEKIYRKLSERLQDTYDIVGGLPDIIEDDWIESEEKLAELMDRYIHLRRHVRDIFKLRYQNSIEPDANRWELCSRVLARQDIVERLSAPW